MCCFKVFGKHFMPFFLLAAIVLFQVPAMASGGIDPADPMVRVTSPPCDLDVNKVLAAVSKDVSRATGIKESFITYYWQTFDHIVYEGKETDRPLYVDLYVPGFFSDDDVKGMLNAVADALVDHAGVERKWLFIHTHFPLPEQVYIGGGIASWDTYRGKPNKNPRDIEERALNKFQFNDASFVFQCLWRFGVIASGASDLGELLTITSRIEDFDKESWYTSWDAMADRVRAMGDEFASSLHARSAKEAYFRATNYYRASEIYLPENDPRKHQAWENGRKAFLKAAHLSGGAIQPVRIPYEKTVLPGYFIKADDSGKKRPLLMIQTGLDGTAEDLYFILGVHAAKRGYNCLIYEGPGQGEAISVEKLPFRYDWEKVVTPVVDYAVSRPEVDPDRLAIIGYSMGGYLVPRALAFEKRIRWGIADGGVYSVYDGTMTKFPQEVRDGVGKSSRKKTVNALAYKEMEKHPDLKQFINQMLWTFDADSPYELFTKLRKYTLEDVLGKIETEMLVLNSSDDQIAGSNAQAKKFYNGLKSKKSYFEFNRGHGAQFHCQSGAPFVSSERILNWLDERAKPQLQ
ncbi:alpha/beta hydrolase [uncultured Pseudodesulfovibrio sp.]|uniref:alpha/beta hydrolase family protein n=1 Tax=uncultured Pseudodesulfovibrio sp. TaxID=2035858 RepID=UPI0029C7A018|nr:alpha/beta hydrolase [uncultured Pseudodesulfovibrio sp.]